MAIGFPHGLLVISSSFRYILYWVDHSGRVHWKSSARKVTHLSAVLAFGSWLIVPMGFKWGLGFKLLTVMVSYSSWLLMVRVYLLLQSWDVLVCTVLKGNLGRWLLLVSLCRELFRHIRKYLEAPSPWYTHLLDELNQLHVLPSTYVWIFFHVSNWMSIVISTWLVVICTLFESVSHIPLKV